MAHLAHYKEAHPLPFVVTHYINLVSMILLILSGLYIHFPPFGGFMGIARGLHIFAGIVLVINCLVRVILAFVLDSAPAPGTRQMEKDYKSWLPQKDNKHQLIPWIKFYLFGKKEHPLSGKFNPLQKTAYILLPILILFMAFTGFCLWGKTMNFPIFLAFTNAVGGLMNVRIIHWFMMFVFIIFMMIHVYMAAVEGGKPLMKLMFARKEHGGYTYDIETHNLGGEDKSV